MFQTATATQSMISASMRQCIEHCTGCHQVCLETIGYCLNQGGQHVAREHLTLMQDCVQICATSADFMLRNSPLHKQICGVCAMIGRRCAEDCRGMGDDEQMQACAEACDRCAESCQRMAS